MTFVWAAVAHAEVHPSGLLADGRSDPLGVATATPRLSWVVEPGDRMVRGVVQTAFEVRVASTVGRLAHPDLWDSGRTLSDRFFAVYAGKPLAPLAPVVWQVRTWNTTSRVSEPIASAWSAPATFALSAPRWDAAWIAASDHVDAQAGPLPLFRREFSMDRRPVRALLMISGLGQYEAHINGHAVTEDLLTPGWTDYTKRVYYNTYDVLHLLRASEANTIGVLLGNGFYSVPPTPGRYTKFTAAAREPRLTAELVLTFADGSTSTIATDATWKTHPGPITFTSVYGGEDFDGRLDLPGWDAPGFDDGTWQTAAEVPGPGGRMVPEQIPPVRSFETYVPKAVTHPKPGVTVFDLGENFAGWPEIAASGPKGAKVTLLAGELLDAQGMVTQRSVNAFPSDPNVFTFTLRGTGRPEPWRPRFSYWGFRYVQVETSDGSVKVDRLVGHFIHASAPVVGRFSASLSTSDGSDLFDRIHTLIDRAILSNMMSVLTDCPTREKLGWLEQTQLNAASIMSNYDVSLLYGKMQDDMEDAQLPEDRSAGVHGGMVPTLAPEWVQFNNAAGEPNDFRDSPEWGSAVILSPWAAYKFYGDVVPLRSHYSSMQRYLDYLRRRRAQSRDGLITYGLGDWYDIGPGEPGLSKLTSAGVTATATFYQDLMAMAHIAALIGQPADAKSYATEAEDVRAAFNAKFFHAATNQYDRGSQTANAMPLALGLVPEGHREAVLANLVADIEAHGYHITAGDIGFHYVVLALMEQHRSDVLVKMLSVTNSPSYAYQLSQGATTLTEAWDANPRSSQNHFMLGHAEEWFYRGLAGVTVDLSRDGAERIEIAPYVPATPRGVSSAVASNATPLGTVSSRWRRVGSVLTLEVTVPPNSTATLTLPAGFQRHLTESGRAIAGVREIHSTPQPNVWILSSGTFRFRAEED